VNNSQYLETEPIRFLEILFDDRLYIARRNSVKIEDIGDWNTYRFFLHTALLLA